MGSVSTIYNGVRQKLAGRALMDVAFSSNSTNGVQNKVIKAKFDEVESALTLNSLGNFNTEAGAASPTISTLRIPTGAKYLYIEFNNLTNGWATELHTVMVDSLQQFNKVILGSIYTNIDANIVLNNGYIGADLIQSGTRVGVVVEVYYR